LIRFTVFTPTFNRESTLPRVWQSLLAQTFRDFEWLVVDDGSTDGTEALVSDWALTAPFPVRYFKQPNSGKHVAMNRAARDAAGEFFIAADSDDAFDADALEVFVSAWDAIAENRDDFVGVTARCRTQNGAFVGTPLPQPVLDSDNLELQFRYGVGGEKWGFVRTSVLRRFPCDENPDMGAFPWAKIAAAGYRTRYIERVLRTYYVDERSDSMSKVVTVKRPMTNVYRNLETMNLAWKYFAIRRCLFVKAALNLARFARAAGLRQREVSRQLLHRGARFLLALVWFPALLRPVKKGTS
jgi:glycosyltransferase involved in cell wall biosynthesis